VTIPVTVAFFVRRSTVKAILLLLLFDQTVKR